MTSRFRQLAKYIWRRLGSAHRDERGTISILTVFVMLMFTMLVMMMVNVAKQLDDKVRMQNGVDAATYSGSVVLARGMNAIAFSNHLEADVFAVTAFLREARDRQAERYVPEILAAWQKTGSLFSTAKFPKFVPLPQSINNKIPLELQFVTAWGEMASAAARNALPVYEYILGTPETVGSQAQDHLIPNFQRAVLNSTPTLAQDLTFELALRHGLRQSDLQQFSRGGSELRTQPDAYAGTRGRQAGVLWRTNVQPVSLGGEFDPLTRTLPVVDPDPYQSDYGALPNAAAYLAEARNRRKALARRYLNDWIQDRDPRRGLDFADEEARMSQYARLFHAAACIQLDKLLNQEYPNTNMPFVLRDFTQPITNERLIDNFTFVGVAYRRHVETSAPKFFRNPLANAADAQTFAEARLYIPRRRYHCCPWITPVYSETGTLEREYANADGWIDEWSTFNQNWTIRLVPATADSLPAILSSNPGGPVGSLRPPNLSGISSNDFRALNTH
jgi:Putative Flp pilus-assembly TadE/G-like